MATISKERKKFGELALEKGLITKHQLDEALKEQEKVRSKGLVQKKIGAILLEKGFIEIEDLNRILEEQKITSFWSRLGSFFSLK